MSVQYGYQGASERYADLQKRAAEEKKRSETFQSKAAPVVRHEGKKRYEILGMLGKGGMGAVYRAYDHLLGRHVAYKVLGEALSRSPEARDNLLHEARAAAQLNHPNVITIFDLGVDQDQTFISMELVEGESYQSLLAGEDVSRHRRSSPLAGVGLPGPRPRARPRHRPSGSEAFERAPRRRPPRQDPRFRSRAARGQRRPVRKFEGALGHSMSGTPKYIPPEAIQGGLIDARSDVYSLGATLYELLTGKAPFTEGNLLVHHLHTPPAAAAEPPE